MSGAEDRASARSRRDSSREPRNQVFTAAWLGGPVGAAAGGAWNARAIARRNGAEKINAVMKTAATACELSHSPAASSHAMSRVEPLD